MSRKMGTKIYEEVRDHDDPDRVYESFVFCAGLNIDMMVKAKQAQIMANEYVRLKEIEDIYNRLQN